MVISSGKAGINASRNDLEFFWLRGNIFAFKILEKPVRNVFTRMKREVGLGELRREKTSGWGVSRHRRGRERHNCKNKLNENRN